MKERKQITYLQRFAWLGSLCLLAVLFMLGACVEVKAEVKHYTCKLQSVTLEINGEKQTYDGKMATVEVDRKADWGEYFQTVKTSDYKVVEDDRCNHEDGHDSITAYMQVWDEENNTDEWIPVSKYRDGLNEYFQFEEEFKDYPYCYMKFCLDGNTENGIGVLFSKKFKIEYELNGGKFMEGREGPEYYLSGEDSDPLPPVEKDGYIFKGWYLEGESEEKADINFYVDCIEEQKDIKVIAYFVEGERQDIGNFKAQVGSWYTTGFAYYKGKGKTVEPECCLYTTGGDQLQRGIDYDYKIVNNEEIASEDAENPPTVIFEGIGAYKGTLEKKFSIIKGKPRNANTVVFGLEGQPLSSIDLSGLEIWDDYSQVIAGTLKWEDETHIVSGETGAYETCNIIFTPEDKDYYEEHYESKYTFQVDVYIRKSIESWTVELDKKNYPYTGELIEPQIVVKDGDAVVEKGNYSVSYSHNVNCDGPAATIKIYGRSKYTGTKEVTFTIDKATPKCETMPVCTAITEGQTLADSTFSGGGVTGVIEGKEVKGSFVWKDPEIAPSLSDSDKTKYTAVFKPLSANYNEIEIELPVLVKDKPVVPTQPPTPTPSASPAGTPSAAPVTPTPTPGETKTDVTASPNPTETTPAPVVTPSNTETENKSDLKVGDKVKDAKKKSYYIVDRVKGDAIEVRYAAPIAKTKIKSVTISETIVLENGQKAKVTAIDKNAFSGCKKLKKVVIGANVTTIKANAFKKCKKLKTIIVKTRNLKKLDKAAWKGVFSKTVIKVPASRYKEYKKLFRNSGLKKSVKIKKY